MADKDVAIFKTFQLLLYDTETDRKGTGDLRGVAFIVVLKIRRTFSIVALPKMDSSMRLLSPLFFEVMSPLFEVDCKAINVARHTCVSL